MLKAWATKAIAAVDARDVVLAVALMLLAVGCGMVWPPLAFVVPGAIIAGVAIFGAPGANTTGE